MTGNNRTGPLRVKETQKKRAEGACTLTPETGILVVVSREF